MRYIDVPSRSIRKRRLLIFVPILILLFFFYVIGFKSSALRRDANNFTNTTNSITAQSNYIGKQFRSAITTGTKNKFLSESFDNMVEQALTQSQKAEEIEVPQDLKLAHSYFVVSMKLRHQGLEKYSRKVLTAVNNETAIIVAKEALEDISLSDTAYNYFVKETKRYLSANNLTFALKNSSYLTSAVKKKVSPMAAKKPAKEKGKPKPKDFDMAVLDVATDPLRVSYNPDNDTRVLPNTDSVDVRIEFENKSVTDLENVTLEISLFNNNKLTAKKKRNIKKFIAKNKRKLTIKNFAPKKDGINVFKITLGDATKDTNPSDNGYTYKFIFESQDNGGSQQ